MRGLPLLLGESSLLHALLHSMTPEEAAGAAWLERAKVEVEAAAFFARLGGRLAGIGAHGTLIEGAHQASRDELKHTKLCVELAAALGAVGDVDRDVAPREIATGVSDAWRVAAECAAMSCITESLSAVALTAMRERAARDDVRAVLHEVLRDEVAHARLGWGYLSSLDDARAKTWLSTQLPAMLRGSVPAELFSDDPEPALASELESLGCLARATRRDVFIAAMRDVVLPGFDACGVATAAARAEFRLEQRTLAVGFST